eukprot:3431166-Prymnesium_polylepis.2
MRPNTESASGGRGQRSGPRSAHPVEAAQSGTAKLANEKGGSRRAGSGSGRSAMRSTRRNFSIGHDEVGGERLRRMRRLRRRRRRQWRHCVGRPQCPGLG